MGNDSCKSFDPNQCNGGQSGGSSLGVVYSLAMGQLIVEGAGFYLQSHSAFQSVLEKVELSELQGLNYDRLNTLIDSAIINMENARVTYLTLYETSKSFDYNPAVLEKLRNFKYDDYMQKNKLNPSVFGKAAGFLSEGDVRGFYKQMKDDTNTICNLLYSIKEKTGSGTFPSLSEVWRVNQHYMESQLFGQYVAEVFNNLE
jgi:hypothetical protein